MREINSSQSIKGFTLIEMVLVVAIITILATMLTPYLIGQLREVRTEKGTSDLDTLKIAMIGDPDIKADGIRTDYGFIGDMGILPGQGDSAVDENALKKLVVQDTQPSYLFSRQYKIGGGWQGPYVTGGASQAPPAGEVKFDPFGQPLVYQVRSPTGLGSNDYVAKITSKGPDKVLGGGDDIIVEVAKKESFSTVFGYVSEKTSGRPLQNIPVSLYYPDGTLDPDPQTGILMKATTTSDTHGYYEFGDIPFGVRSIVMEPKLVYAVDSDVSFDDDDDDHHHHHGTNIRFRVANYSLSVVDIMGVTVYYDTMPTAYFSEMEIGDTVVFKATGPDFARKGSGEPVSVSPPIGVAGTSSPFTPMVVHVDSVKTRVSDLTIDSSESGASVQVEIKRFRDARWQGGQPVDVTGVQFTVVFQHSDGSASTVTFTPTRGED